LSIIEKVDTLLVNELSIKLTGFSTLVDVFFTGLDGDFRKEGLKVCLLS